MSSGFRGISPLLLAGTVAAGFVIVTFLWSKRLRIEGEKAPPAAEKSSPKKKSAAGDKGKKKKAAVKKDDGGKRKEGTADIEDLMGTSLIPQVMKQMKKDGVKPYTMDEKKVQMKELQNLAVPKNGKVPNFAAHLAKKQLSDNLKRTHARVLQLNIGFYCNQACTHCHVDSSPKRKEMMTRAMADKCVSIVKNSPSIEVIDLTGGAPELNREFRHLVREMRKLGRQVLDRCNLTVLLEPRMEDLPQFLADNEVRIIASLPCYLEDNVDTQRGDNIFRRSIKGLQLLNDQGYGKGTFTDKDGKEKRLSLDLVYNPTGVHLPPAREKLEGDYKRELKKRYGIVFDNLHCITNMPINRFYDHLKDEKKLDTYMDILLDNFNPDVCKDLMCRSYISVDPYGVVFDCDFNQQLDMTLHKTGPGGKSKKITVFDFDSTDELMDIRIKTSAHCFGCTAGSGSG